MKTLVAIWLAVLVSAIGTVGYVNAEINKLVVVQAPANSLQQTINGDELQPANGLKVETYNPQQTINASELQGGQ